MSLFQLSNGAHVRILLAKDLVKLPVWRGNRLLDYEHVEEIKRDIGDHVNLLDHGYHIATIVEMDAGGTEIKQKYIMDGQHRQQVLKAMFETNPFAMDFPVLVFEREFDSEAQLIESFNAINKCKPLKPMEDENLLVNAHIVALQAMFDPKKKFLRPGTCRRPYLSIDKLRDALKAHFTNIPKTERGIQRFAEAVKAYNARLLADESFYEKLRSVDKRKFFESGKQKGFVLAFDDKLPWISTVLKEL